MRIPISKYQIIFIVFSTLVITGLFLWIYISFLPETAVHRTETSIETPDKTAPISPCRAGKGLPSLKVDCLILHEEYCDKGELLYNEEKELIGLGFNLPIGTKIYAPFDGYIDNSLAAKIFDGVSYGFYISEKSGDKQRNYFNIIGEVETIESGRLANEAVQKEELVAETTGGKSQRVITLSGNYDVVIYFMAYDIEKNLWSYNTDIVRQFFPYIRE